MCREGFLLLSGVWGEDRVCRVAWVTHWLHGAVRIGGERVARVSLCRWDLWGGRRLGGAMGKESHGWRCCLMSRHVAWCRVRSCRVMSCDVM